LGVRGRYREGADRADRVAVEGRPPRAPGVARLPHAAVHAAEVEVLGLARHAGDREDAAAPEGADEPPAEVLEERRVDARDRRRDRAGDEQTEEADHADR